MSRPTRSPLAAARERAGLSQEALAERLGVTRTTVASWERGRTGIYPRNRFKLAEALGLSVDQVERMAGVDSPVGQRDGERGGAACGALTDLTLDAVRLGDGQLDGGDDLSFSSHGLSQLMSGASKAELVGLLADALGWTEGNGQALPVHKIRARLQADEVNSLITHELGTMTNTDDLELDELEGEVRKLVSEHLYIDSVLLYGRTARVRDIVNDRLAGVQTPRQRTRLLLLGSIALAMIADTYVIVGEHQGATRVAEGAYRLAGTAEHTPMMRWTLSLKAYAEYFASGPTRAIRELDRMPSAHEGSPLEQMIDLNSRALFEAARSNEDKARSAHDAMTEIEAEIQPGPSYFSDFGGMLAVPFEKRAQFRAGAYALLGEYGAAEQIAQRSLEVYESNPTTSRAYGNEADCRITIAVARLAESALEDSVEAVEPVLALPRDERARWFVDRLVDYGLALRQHEQYGSSSLASIVSEQISEFSADTAELPAGTETP